MTHGFKFICGGAWSGKTAHAVSCAKSYENVIWLGTASNSIHDLGEHIKNMRTRRPGHWSHVDAPFDLTKNLERAASDHKQGAIVIDSVSQWLSNEIARMAQKHDERQLTDAMHRDIDELYTAVTAISQTRPVIVVSSDFGQSPPPVEAAQRVLRMTVGNANSRLAMSSGTTDIIMSGLVIFQKK